MCLFQSLSLVCLSQRYECVYVFVCLYGGCIWLRQLYSNVYMYLYQALFLFDFLVLYSSLLYSPFYMILFFLSRICIYTYKIFRSMQWKGNHRNCLRVGNDSLAVEKAHSYVTTTIKYFFVSSCTLEQYRETNTKFSHFNGLNTNKVW